jgi:hypothetical protein
MVIVVYDNYYIYNQLSKKFLCLVRSYGDFSELIEFGAPDFPGELVNMLMITWLTGLTGWGIRFIMSLYYAYYAASLFPASPLLGVLLLGSSEAVKKLCPCGQRISDAKIQASR